MENSILDQLRLTYKPKLPRILQNYAMLAAEALSEEDESALVRDKFPLTGNQGNVDFKERREPFSHAPLRVGVVLSGGQAPGGHNVITGIFDGLASRYPGSVLIGFLDGPSGIVNHRWKELTVEVVRAFRNMGGFDMIGSGRTKIETPEQFAAARAIVQELDLDGLVIVGGDDSNTNAAFLAEDFKSHGLKTRVVGVPKTIDGDLKNAWIQTSFGFDTACKTYAETIGNLARDTLSAKKYYYFIKLMGRSASHIALECALQTQPNYAIISEEVEALKKTLGDIVNEIADVICERANHGKDYGIILIPEGLLEFIPQCKTLIQELNALVSCSSGTAERAEISQALTEKSKACFDTFPKEIQQQLLLDRDPHGNVQVSKIETERLLMDLVKKELNARAIAGTYRGTFAPQPHFCGYEGRSCLPSNFDAHYCYALGHVAVLLIGENLTGFMACVGRLTAPVEEWEIGGAPLVNMIHEETRKGKTKLVIKKALVELQGGAFKDFSSRRASWIADDAYLYPGPIQFFGPSDLTDSVCKTLFY